MQFLKKHYEKIVLSVVLLGLAAAAAALPYMVSQVTEQIDSMVSSVQRSKPKPWPVLDLSTNQEAVGKIEAPAKIQLAGLHNLFNPVKWIKSKDGRLVKLATGNEVGVGAMRLNKIEGLDLTVVFEGISTNSDKPQYTLTLIKEESSSLIRTNTRSAPLGIRGQYFTIEKIIGPAEAPDGVMARLRDGAKDEAEVITVSKDKPFVRRIGYIADLSYPREKQEFKKQRVNDKISLKNELESYKIVAINESEVVLSAVPGDKRTTLKLNPSL